MSGKRVYSAFTDDVPFPVFSRDEWWGDTWDAYGFGRPFDFSQPFFVQFQRLRNAVPHICALTAGELENCDFSNNIAHAKNCYLVFSTTFVEDSMYCESIYRCRDCIDCSYSYSSELCYDCLACANCYNVQGSICSEDCRDSHFLLNCRSCRNCFGCVNLSHAEYCVFNERRTKSDYQRFLARYDLATFGARESLREQAEQCWLRHPRPHVVSRSAERVSGNFIFDARDVIDSYIIRGGENLRCCFHCHEGAKDCGDLSVSTLQPELLFECLQILNGAFQCQFCFFCTERCANCLYCWMCFNCRDCFGCVGLRKKQYCVFNVQYAKGEYERLVAQIIEHMQTTGEWGEFFPMELSPTPYNRSLAQRYFPMTRDSCKDAGLWWYDKPLVSAENAIEASVLPDGLPQSDAPLVVKSARSGVLYRITAEEIRRYRDFKVPLPRLTYDERLEDRALQLGGVNLYDRQCPATGRMLRSPYPPDSPWIVWDKEEYERVLFS